MNKELGAITDQWSKMPRPLIIDSGAAASAIPQEWFQNYAIEETPESKPGCKYTAANGDPITNYGKRTLKAMTPEGEMTRMTMHVCDVTRALASVSSMCRAGNRVVFDEEGSYIEDKSSGKATWLKQEDGVYVLDLDIAPAGYQSDCHVGRQGK